MTWALVKGHKGPVKDLRASGPQGLNPLFTHTHTQPVKWLIGHSLLSLRSSNLRSLVGLCRISIVSKELVVAILMVEAPKSSETLTPIYPTTTYHIAECDSIIITISHKQEIIRREFLILRRFRIHTERLLRRLSLSVCLSVCSSVCIHAINREPLNKFFTKSDIEKFYGSRLNFR
jgi:hypothetical protein